MTDLSPIHVELVERVPLPEGARVEARDVDYAHDGVALRGHEARRTDAGAKRPAVLVVHDWYGLRDYAKARAQMLARLGYHAFAVDVYGAGVSYDDPEQAKAAAGRFYADPALLTGRIRAAYDVVAADPEVDAARISIIGYCFGGSASLEFARTGAPLVVTASFHGGLNTHDPADVDRIQGSILIATGASDPVVPDSAIASFQDELRTNPGLDWQVQVYSGAPHAFTLPGIPAYREGADRRSWAALVELLAERNAQSS
ncbi:MAG: dienelactone hydrolase family protein [Microbacterium sp.]|uniref:dienelactone hydrolase family protein n=1 Tax=Microbacterium sp. TaxID=51671 RepID=UPI0039E2E4B8